MSKSLHPKNKHNNGYNFDFLSEKYHQYEYFIPEKQDWLVEPKNGEVWFSFEIVLQSILLHFKDCKNPLVWIKKSDTEFEKCFVVDW